MTSASVQPSPIPDLTARDFARLRGLIEARTGIFVAESKRALLVSRLSRRLRALGMSSFAEYTAQVLDDPEEQVRMVDAICIHETHFFREPKHFEFLAERLLPEWRGQAERGQRPARVRAWSAACSTGEEPYSIAMTLKMHLPDSWEVAVMASDVSTRALAATRDATWPIERAGEIPPTQLKRFMLRGTGSQLGKMRARRELRDVVEVVAMNLNQAAYPVGHFDLVFCRNVLFYFRPESRATIVERLLANLAPGGYLFLGHAEVMLGASQRLRSVLPTVYTRR